MNIDYNYIIEICKRYIKNNYECEKLESFLFEQLERGASYEEIKKYVEENISDDFVKSKILNALNNAYWNYKLINTLNSVNNRLSNVASKLQSIVKSNQSQLSL